MSEANALIVELGNHNVELWVDGGELRYRAPQGTMTSQLKARLAENKLAVISSLTERKRSRSAEGHSDAGFALTELQHAYMLGHAAIGGLSNLPARIYFEFELAELNVARLEQVVSRLIARHDALRAQFSRDGSQRVLPNRPLAIAQEDLRGQSRELLAARRLSKRTSMAGDSIDPFGGSPFAIACQQTDSGWVLFVCASLMVIDGTSLRTLIEEGMQLYRNPAASLPPLGISYKQCAEALAEARNSTAYAASLAYWRARLADLPSAPELPLVATESARPDRFRRRTKQIAATEWQTFKANCTEAGLTASVALCSAYAATLAAFSRHFRFLLNVMHLNRPALHPDFARVVGNFASTTLLSVEVDPRDSFVDNARRLRRQLLADLEHAAVSGMVVVRELNASEQASPRARAPVVFASALDSTNSEGLGWLERLKFGALDTPHVWLDHQVLEDGGRVVLNWDAVEELFPPGLLDAAFDAYGALVDRLVHDPAAWAAPPRMTPAECSQLVAAVNDTKREFSSATLHGLFMSSARRTPDAPAVIAADMRLSYAELAERATAVAAWLVRRGARRNRLVAVVMEKGWQQIVAVLAVGLAGAAYLPIDPALPAERIGFLLGQCEPGLSLTQERIESLIAWPEGFQHLNIDGALEAEELPRTIETAPDDLAYVIFTSGSTGIPKGVMISQQGAVNTVLDVNERFSVAATDRVLALSSLSFDLSVYDVFGLLAAGGAIVIPPPSAARDPAHWLELLARERVTIWNSVPALMQLLVEYAGARDHRLGEQLRLVMLSGDWIPVRLPDSIRGLAPRASVMSLGGATEASIWSILYPTDGVPADAPSIPYGTPMANQQVYVLDDALEARPVWVPGEIYIGGVGVAHGYFGDPVRTAERFLTHPRTKQRLYRTGDVGRLLPDGAIEFLGREDAQVKVQGFRIELGEIERALERAPGVRTAVVTAVGERTGAKTLSAHVVPLDPAVPLDQDALRGFLGATLPAYMVPARVAIVAALPLSSNGKVDRSRLTQTEAVHRPEFVAPCDGLEASLARVWCDVLRLDRVGANDDFFALGGDSLLAVRLAAAVSSRLSQELPISSLFSHSKLREQASLLGSVSAASKSLVCLRPGVGTPFVLVHPVGGNVLCYRDFVRVLRSDAPVYGLQADDRDTQPTTLPEMAARYVTALREVVPHGPYRLGGWSLGGFLAVEMARLLRVAGEPVDYTFVIDSRLPAPGAGAIDRAQLIVRFLGDMTGGSLVAPARLLSEMRGAPADESVRFAHRWALETGGLPQELSLEAFRRLFLTFERNARALFRYTPLPQRDFPVHAFAADSSFADHEELAWEKVERFAGDHYTIMRSPSLERIAASIGQHLQSEQGVRS